ncbi:MAG: CheR family methyltransferase, partial [Anaerolineae bacterium]
FRETRARQWRAHYFSSQDGRWALGRQVKQMVTFHHLNLASDEYPTYETNTCLMDLIICRNVTIYFSEAATRRLVNQMYDALVDGGWLIVGHSEPSPLTYRRFTSRVFPNAVLYQRTGQPTTLPQAWESLPGGRQAPPFQPTQPAPIPPPRPTHTPPSHQHDTPPILDAQVDDPCDPVEKAADLLDYGYSAQARDLLLENIDQQDCAPRAAILLGQAYANLGNWTEAERWCREAIRLDKLALQAYYVLALVLQHQAHLDKAIEAMKKVVYIDRNYVLGHFGLADMYRNRGQWPQAQKALDNARRLLDAKSPQELIPGSGGITAGRLRETIVRQQQQIQRQAHNIPVANPGKNGGRAQE